ncbi:FlgK family flagellar hook-associated protein [Arcobacter sp.]|uniref:FlgK family flagellar hook-associated protein n=1 Tax=Arcobacter sp. TaxID=1872629 RepID=UPI003D0E4EC1
MLNSLNVAQSGLAAARISVENTMNNISNANTEGYKKRVVETSEMAHSDDRLWGRGVSVDDTIRISSQYLYDNIIKQNSKENYQSQLSFMLENIESIFQETDEAGLSLDLDKYFQSIESLRANPNNEVYKNDLKLSGQLIVDGLNRLYEGIEDQEKVFQQALEANINDVNLMLNDIGNINRKINEQGFASNDLLDKRDLLEKQLSDYVDVTVNRDNNGVYELKIGGEIAISNTTVAELSLGQEYTEQIDRYVTDTGSKSNILTSTDVFDQEDVITFELDNQHSVSVEYGETMLFDLDGDGTEDIVKVDETNYVRALVHKINTNIDLATKVKAFNGNYGIDEKGNKFTIDSQDKFLVIEAKVPGTDGKFDSRVIFTEEAYSTNEATYTVNPSINNNPVTIQSKFATDGLSLTHSIDLGAPSAGEVFDIDLSNNYGTSGTVTLTNGVTYNAATNKLTVPAGVESFTITVDSIEQATGTLPYGTGTAESSIALFGKTQEYTLSLTGTSNTITSVLNVVNDGKDVTQDYKISTSTTNTNNIVSAIPNVNEITGAAQASGTLQVSSIKSLAAVDGSSITHTVNLKTATTNTQVMKISFSDDTGSYFDQTPVFVPDNVTYDIETGQITIPAGISSFTFTTPTNELADVNTDQTYSFSITDNAAASGSQPVTMTSTLVINNKEGQTSRSIYKQEVRSASATNAITVNTYDEPINITSGKIKAIIENLVTDSGKNIFDEYKKSLDDFAKTFVDITSSYIKNNDGTYINGEIATDNNIEIADDIDLFSGSSVRTMKFNASVVGNMKQKDYDYLATHQWKEDISFLGFGQDKNNELVANDSEVSSLSQFLQKIRTTVSKDKESNDFVLETQKAVVESLQNTYDLKTKVDNDEEMINLMKFQAAYSANAKMITTVDEMLQTLLGLKR